MVSVIIPIYNVEKYLKKCIESVINQTFSDLEIILVNDGSTDNCREICENYKRKDDRIKLINKKNGGLSSARNAGIEIANGDYYTFIDSDDYITSDILEKMHYSQTGSNIMVMKYGTNGYRYVKKENSNVPEYYIYDQQGRLQTEVTFVNITINGTKQIIMYPEYQYIWGPDKVIAQFDVLNNEIYYYLYNGHGDVVQIVDTDGNIVNSYDYDAWGNFITKNETVHNPFTYFGQFYDEATGLYYLRARYYDPTTGRFTQQDPAEDGYNWYIYGNNNPILYVDPSGEIAITTVIIIGAVVGAVVGGFAGAYVSKKATGNVSGTSVAIGILGGATLGGLFGWGIYSLGASVSAAGMVSTMPGIYKTLDKGVNFAYKALQHMDEKARQVPIQVLIEAIKSGTASADPQGSNAIMYTTEMVKNGTTYTLEVLYDVATNTIWHFKYFR